MTLQQSLTKPLPFSNGCYSFKKLFFSPIRFCGRQWMWMNSDSGGRVSQVFFKVLASPFLVCSTFLSGVIAITGALAFPADSIPSCTKHNPGGDITLLNRSSSNEQVEDKIRSQLAAMGYKCSVRVKSSERTYVATNHYPENIHRYITLTKNSTTSISSLWKVIENHFWNKNSPSLDPLYSCIWQSTSKNVEQLKEVLALYGAITFSIAFDLAYVRTELGRDSFRKI